ncbi:hypothetical protein PRIPAC_76608 [Pristionchus pacificus]|uniref:Uncharacterized protein n=1 Tax=Pristionchus pacificus TaxID=54126 RepID=A0A2A6CR43_PRIPA|nr:hypothetical protein PRIPAC_76608 [Pristionchus pacificus]|eukprot:PDM80566.1 hypothetical protein PRIPAC_35569 [Pristionchus pacificus]
MSKVDRMEQGNCQKSDPDVICGCCRVGNNVPGLSANDKNEENDENGADHETRECEYNINIEKTIHLRSFLAPVSPDIVSIDDDMSLLPLSHNLLSIRN